MQKYNFQKKTLFLYDKYIWTFKTRLIYDDMDNIWTEYKVSVFVLIKLVLMTHNH